MKTFLELMHGALFGMLVMALMIFVLGMAIWAGTLVEDLVGSPVAGVITTLLLLGGVSGGLFEKAFK
jgi:hypothetical protein